MSIDLKPFGFTRFIKGPCALCKKEPWGGSPAEGTWARVRMYDYDRVTNANTYGTKVRRLYICDMHAQSADVIEVEYLRVKVVK